MTTLSPQPDTTAAAIPPPHARLYLRILFLALAFTYLLPFLLVRTPIYDRLIGTFYGPVLDYGFSLNHTDADIVVFGDSSAMFAFDPLTLDRQLGLKLVNLPNTMGSLPVTHEYVLDRYLQHNRPPRLIVFYFAPWNLDYAHDHPTETTFEGEDMLLRHASTAQLAAYYQTRLLRLIEYPLEFYSLVPSSTFDFLRHRSSPFSQAAGAQGHMNYPARAGAMSAPCTIPDDLLQRSATATADRLLQTYRTPATQTLLYLAPVPACANSALLAQRIYRNHQTQPPDLLPPDMFGLGYTHLRTQGVPQETALFLHAIRQQLAQPN